jgi:hypothetical protein
MKRKILILIIILLLIFVGSKYYNEYYSNNFYYNKDYNFKFRYPENWRNKVMVSINDDYGFTEVIFYYTGYKTPFDAYQPFFSIMLFEKSYIDKHKDFNPEKSQIIKKNNEYTIVIFKDLGNSLAGKEATKEYIELEIPNDEIIRRVEFIK